MERIKEAGLAILAGVIIGLSLGWVLYHPRGPRVEAPASAARQADGSLVLERTGTGAKTDPPPHEIPKGGKVERRVSVTVQPRTPPHTPGPEDWSRAPAPVCPPVRVDLSLVRMPDQTRRVVASSPTGEVVGGLDMPAEPPRLQPRAAVWSTGASYDPINRSYGAFVTRDLGPFRVGVEAYQQKQTGAAARVMVGIRW